MAIRSSLANNATPSSYDSRSPASTFSAIVLSSFDNAVETMPFSIKLVRRGVARQSDYTNIASTDQTVHLGAQVSYLPCLQPHALRARRPRSQAACPLNASSAERSRQ